MSPEEEKYRPRTEKEIWQKKRIENTYTWQKRAARKIKTIVDKKQHSEDLKLHSKKGPNGTSTGTIGRRA